VTTPGGRFQTDRGQAIEGGKPVPSTSSQAAITMTSWFEVPVSTWSSVDPVLTQSLRAWPDPSSSRLETYVVQRSGGRAA